MQGLSPKGYAFNIPPAIFHRSIKKIFWEYSSEIFRVYYLGILSLYSLAISAAYSLQISRAYFLIISRVFFLLKFKAYSTGIVMEYFLVIDKEYAQEILHPMQLTMLKSIIIIIAKNNATASSRLQVTMIQLCIIHNKLQ